MRCTLLYVISLCFVRKSKMSIFLKALDLFCAAPKIQNLADINLSLYVLSWNSLLCSKPNGLMAHLVLLVGWSKLSAPRQWSFEHAKYAKPFQQLKEHFWLKSIWVSILILMQLLFHSQDLVHTTDKTQDADADTNLGWPVIHIVCTVTP